MKKILMLLLSAVLAFSAVFVAPPTARAVANPMQTYGSFAELSAADQNIHMCDAPHEATNVTYALIAASQPHVAQIEFTVGADSFTYRAAACASEAAAVDIAGVYDQFANSKELSSEDNHTHGGGFKLEYNDNNPMGLATWYDEATKCQYSVFTATGCGTDQKIEEIVDELRAVPGFDYTLYGGMTDATVAGTVDGTVVAVDANDIVINMSNGNTLTFMMNYIASTEAKAGDKVTIAYAGDIANLPEAVTITVTQAAPTAVNGTVVQFDATSVYIKTTTGNTYGFIKSAKTTITGVAKKLSIGDVISLTYSGSLTNEPTAVAIEILSIGNQKEDPVNKTLEGKVTKLASKSFTIQSSNGKKWTFKKDATTQITGKYTFETGCRVIVTYDGYASKSPLAKSVNVIAPPDPTPPDPVYHTVKGTVDSYYGVFLTLTNGYGFNLTYASISGDTDAIPGDKARVTYYVEGGIMYATKVTFTHVYYDPAPNPNPDPDPDPDPFVDGGDVAAS